MTICNDVHPGDCSTAASLESSSDYWICPNYETDNCFLELNFDDLYFITGIEVEENFVNTTCHAHLLRLDFDVTFFRILQYSR